MTESQLRGRARGSITRYNDAWNAHDVDAIVALHAPAWCSRTTRPASGSKGDAVREHIATIFQNWPDLTFSSRRLYARDGLVVSEWTARATRPETGEQLEWDGVDVFPFEDGKIARKDVYSAAHRARVLSG